MSRKISPEKTKATRSRPIGKIQKEAMKTLIVLVTFMTVLIAAVSVAANINSERERLDRNLENMAQAVAGSQVVKNALARDSDSGGLMQTYLDSLKNSLSGVDVISVVGADGIRKYHTNAALIGTVYDGTLPEFSERGKSFYVTGDTGPSGAQRRAYCVIYSENGEAAGFVLAVMLQQNINRLIINTVAVHTCAAAVVLGLAGILSRHLSDRIKKLLLGYEPDTFSAMFSLRDNILESLEEGILAFDREENVIYLNGAAQKMLCIKSGKGQRVSDICRGLMTEETLKKGEKIFGAALHTENSLEIIADLIPVMEQEKIVGGLCIMRDRTEFTKLMEDLSGVRYMVDSMRANNHDFNNKLHVILGLIQMGNTKEAIEYIGSYTSTHRRVMQNIIKNIEDPTVAALLIGKWQRAGELGIDFALEKGSKLTRSDISVSSGDLVTIIGNLLDNAMDAMNEKEHPPKELTVGIFTKPGALVINVDDTGGGIPEENREKIFENGFSTKGEGRGTGLYVVSGLVKRCGGSMEIESEIDVGTSFTVSINS
ncbi:MAG: sensor histidine kinase [Oscillospiraceae bacterium]|nr:sensor histidine kinase [Oscillospiraceae bacterium]